MLLWMTTLEQRPVVLGEEKLAARRCPRHPRYQGFRVPKLSNCEICWAILKYNREVGVREFRAPRKKTYTEIVKENL